MWHVFSGILDNKFFLYALEVEKKDKNCKILSKYHFTLENEKRFFLTSITDSCGKLDMVSTVLIQI